MTSHKPLPRSAIVRLLCFLVVGGLIGAAAAFAPNPASQIALVCIAVLVGIWAGLSIRAVRRTL